MLQRLLPILVSSTLCGVTITVYNDSSYVLDAQILSVNNEELSTMTLYPDHYIKWQDNLFDAKDYAKGPFRVIFTCPNGNRFGTSIPVSQNSTVYAQRTRGPKKCRKDTQPDQHRDYDDRPPHAKF